MKSDLRSAIHIPDRMEPHQSARYPPYTQANYEALAVKSGAIEAPATAAKFEPDKQE